MKRLIASIFVLLSVATPTSALSSPLKPSIKLAQVNSNQAYLSLLNQVLAKHAPAYLDISDKDKLSYGHYTCQALDAGMAIDTLFVNYVQAIKQSVPTEEQYQAGIFLGSSMAVGVRSFCPEHLPQLVNWLRVRGFISMNQPLNREVLGSSDVIASQSNSTVIS